MSRANAPVYAADKNNKTPDYKQYHDNDEDTENSEFNYGTYYKDYLEQQDTPEEYKDNDEEYYPLVYYE